LNSPIDGVVIERIHQSEATLPRGAQLLVLANLTDLEIVADYLSTEAVRMAPGTPVLIDRWGGDQLLRGRIRRVEPAAFTKISALGVEEQRVNVIVDFDDPAEAWTALGDEYRIETRVVVHHSQDALLVPDGAVFPHNNGWAIFLAGAERAELRPISIGQRNETFAEVLSGLTLGDPVIVYPSDDVTDGVLIEPRAAPAR
jgi:HlyD family secretion protein